MEFLPAPRPARSPSLSSANVTASVIASALNRCCALLPLTLPNVENEVNFTSSQWPGDKDATGERKAVYTEKLEVGYRWYHAHGIRPAFAFGLALVGLLVFAADLGVLFGDLEAVDLVVLLFAALVVDVFLFVVGMLWDGL